MVIGHSGHAYMAPKYAKRYPACTTRVAMIGIAPSLSQANMQLADQNYHSLADNDRLAAEQQNLLAHSDEKLAALSPSEAFIRGLFIRNGARFWYDPRFDSTPLWEGVTINTDMFGYVWGKLFAEIDITRGLDGFDVPVFLALGRYDFMTAAQSSWDGLKSRFKNLTFRILEKSGHTPQLEEPEEFDRELLTWMAAT
jgi:proline iminopeptidase